jgi:hypothetical protein
LPYLLLAKSKPSTEALCAFAISPKLEPAIVLEYRHASRTLGGIIAINLVSTQLGSRSLVKLCAKLHFLILEWLNFVGTKWNGVVSLIALLLGCTPLAWALWRDRTGVKSSFIRTIDYFWKWKPEYRAVYLERKKKRLTEEIHQLFARV